MKPIQIIAALGILTAALVAAVIWIWGDSIGEFLKPVKPAGVSSGRDARILFGKKLSPDGRSVQEPTTTFTLGEDIAWVLQFKNQARTSELVVELYELTGEGVELFLDRNKMTVEPTDDGVYNFASTNAFWSLSPQKDAGNSHTFRIKYIRETVVAQGDFSIIAGGAESGGP
ncbi:MAG TPA: hypothetical protein VIU33_09570 [Nitrospiria bacterium]